LCHGQVMPALFPPTFTWTSFRPSRHPCRRQSHCPTGRDPRGSRQRLQQPPPMAPPTLPMAPPTLPMAPRTRLNPAVPTCQRGGRAQRHQILDELHVAWLSGAHSEEIPCAGLAVAIYFVVGRPGLSDGCFRGTGSMPFARNVAATSIIRACSARPHGP